MLARSLALILAIPLLILLTSCASVNTCVEGLTRSNFRVMLTNGACFGACPVYDGTIYGDGTVEYIGGMHTQHEGQWSGTVDATTLCTLKRLIEENSVMTMKENHVNTDVQDAPMHTLTIEMGGQKRVIRWNLGMPEQVRDIEALMVRYTHEAASSATSQPQRTETQSPR